MSPLKQRLITAGVVALAIGALLLGAAYQGDRDVNGAPVIGNSTFGLAQQDPASSSAAGNGGMPPAVVNPIEGFMPKSGQGSACREAVGVDLKPGYSAIITINGIEIPPEELNVKLDDDGSISREITASRSLGHFVYGPEPDCPNGPILRATDNLLRVCVYRPEDGPASCEVTEYSFNTL